jgi:hypothetical protein
MERFIPNPKLKLREQLREVMRFKHFSTGQNKPTGCGFAGSSFFTRSGIRVKWVLKRWNSKREFSNKLPIITRLWERSRLGCSSARPRTEQGGSHPHQTVHPFRV